MAKRNTPSRAYGRSRDRAAIRLSRSEAASLAAIRNGAVHKTAIAIAAKLNLKTTAAALDQLASLRLIGRGEHKQWRLKGRAARSAFEIVPDRKRRVRATPGGSGHRLLDALDHPMSCTEIAEKLGLSRQRIYQLVVELHAQGRVRFGDGTHSHRIVARSDDPVRLLSREEARALSVVPREIATSAGRIGTAAHLPGSRVHDVLARLLAAGLVATAQGAQGETLYRIRPAGLAHPQYRRLVASAAPPRLPVESDRVMAVLSLISDAGRVRIHEVGTVLGIPLPSINALFQYLKRKALVQKRGPEPHAPYELTDAGRRVLAEMIGRRAA